MIGHLVYGSKNNSLKVRSKFKGKYKSPRKYKWEDRKCGKDRNYKKYFRSNNIDKNMGSNDVTSIYGGGGQKKGMGRGRENRRRGSGEGERKRGI